MKPLPPHLRTFFRTSNDFELPELPEQTFSPDLCAVIEWLPYNRRDIRRKAGVGLHFFIDDFRFEAVFERHRQALKAIYRFALVCSPDFSLYADMPYPLQLYQVYKNRWVSAYWTGQGLHVVYTLQWGDESTYPFCFAGIPKNQVLAVSGLSPKYTGQEIGRYLDGLEHAQATLKPKHLLIFGGEVPRLSTSYTHLSLNTFYRAKPKNSRGDLSQNSAFNYKQQQKQPTK